ncbi:HNH endonuclease [Thalassospira povalilytica]|uniref:HNH endonuclease n=1 Tax=Thalassospira povalilytica TaxID=732237 RepID=UPI001D18D63C|nr:HNH endonuclease [Thalassospira povalilytica]MCC4241748.1 HNH endonuclease [Thalassospira povalilytica]
MFAIAPTDLSWFAHMQNEVSGRVVNFWTPTPWRIKGLQTNDRLYFMLKAPIRRIGGYATFVRYVEMTATEAWSNYGLGNGVSSQHELIGRIKAFANKRSKSFTASDDPLIGCIELADIVTLDEERFIDPTECGHLFPKEVVKLKYFHEEDRISASLGTGKATTPFTIVSATASHKHMRRKDRKGLATFRQQILRNYGYRCCILGESIVELLEAAHIQTYVDERSNHPQNGICLRVDLHRLFDEGLISITNEYTVQVSPKLADTSYATLDGKAISLPSEPSAYPSVEALTYQRTAFR